MQQIFVNCNTQKITLVESKSFDDLKKVIEKKQGYKYFEISKNCLTIYNDIVGFLGFYTNVNNEDLKIYQAAEKHLQETIEKGFFVLNENEHLATKEYCLNNQECKQWFKSCMKNLGISDFWIINPKFNGGYPKGFSTISEYFFHIKKVGIK